MFLLLLEGSRTKPVELVAARGLYDVIIIFSWRFRLERAKNHIFPVVSGLRRPLRRIGSAAARRLSPPPPRAPARAGDKWINELRNYNMSIYIYVCVHTYIYVYLIIWQYVLIL